MDFRTVQDYIAAMAGGQWGFAFVPPTGSGVGLSPDLLSFQVPPYLTRSWTITLGAFRFGELGPGGGLLLGNAQPSDNQTTSDGFMRVNLNWGSFAMTERAIVDYPARGCSFQIQASIMRLQVSWGVLATNQAPPHLAGFISPTARGVTALNGAPTFTTSFSPSVAPAGSSRRIPVPDRAVAYRFVLATGAVASTIQLYQQNGNGASIQYDGTFPTVTSPALASPDDLMGNAAGYIPLNPSSQFVLVTNTDGLTPLLIALQFLLDLG